MKYRYPLLFVLSLAGCFSLDLAQEPPSKQQYLLGAAPKPSSAESGPAAAEAAATTDLGALQVNKAFVAAPFHEKSLVYRIGDNQYTTDYYHEFLVSPAQRITQLAVDFLRGSGASPRAHQDSTSAAERVLDLTVLELYGDYREAGRQQAVLRLRAVLSAPDPEDDSLRPLFEKDYDARVDTADRQASTLVAGMNRALEEVLGKLAADLRNRRH